MPKPCVVPAVLFLPTSAPRALVKHASASEVAISVDCTPAEVLLRVTDDGLGFDPDATRSAVLSLGIMRERANEIGHS